MGRFTHVHGDPGLECVFGFHCPVPGLRFVPPGTGPVRTQGETPYEDTCSGCAYRSSIVAVQDHARPPTHFCGPCWARQTGTRAPVERPTGTRYPGPTHREGCTHRGCHPLCEVRRARYGT